MSVTKRRRQAVNRRRWVTELLHRHEDRAFFEHGTIPPSATSASICCCGAKSFGRGELDYDAENDWYDAHADCGVTA